MSTSFRVSINAELLIWAIDNSGYELQDVASSVGVSLETLLSWRSGESMPTWRQLKALANKTGRPVAAFYLPSPPDVPRRLRDFRTYPGAVLGHFSPELRKLIRQARSLREQALELFDTLEEPPEFPDLPFFKIRDSVTDCADTLRNFVGITVDQQLAWPGEHVALNAWREILFDEGVFVVQLAIDKREARGFSDNYDRLNLIAVSAQEDYPCARIFSVFHEVCHLCLRKAGVSDPRSYVEEGGHHATVERFCDRVAGAFLVPVENKVVRTLLQRVVASGRVDLDELKRASGRLKVSQSAILYRMVEARLIEQADYHDILAYWQDRGLPDKRKIKVRVARRRVASLGKRYAQMVMSALDSGSISSHEASSLLGARPRWLSEIRAEAYLGVTYG